MAIEKCSIVALWYRVNQLAKSGTSGYDDQDEFNGKVDTAQKAMHNTFIDNVKGNQKITEAMNWSKKKSTGLVSSSTGLVTLPDDYFRLDIMSYLDADSKPWPSILLDSHELDMTRTSSVRGPDLVNKTVYHYFDNNALYFMPEQVVNLLMRYWIVAPPALITLTPNSDDNSDYLVPTTTAEFVWPSFCFNLLTYLVLEQFGIECKEQLLVEYAELGITRETFKK